VVYRAPGAVGGDLSGTQPVFANTKMPAPPRLDNGGESLRLVAPLTLQNHATFLGYKTANETLVPGRENHVETVWRVPGPVTDALPSVFAHLADSSGAVLATGDGLDFSAVQWQEGDVFAQVHTFDVPLDVPSDRYWISVGMYDSLTGLRYGIVSQEHHIDTLWIGPLNIAGE
jgi:hypothetical protein